MRVFSPSKLTAIGAVGALICASLSSANDSIVVGGQTSVLLDFATLESAASLALAGTTGSINSSLGPNTVDFGINSRDAATLPTTFSYDPDGGLAAGTFAGTIEHTGTVTFTNTVDSSSVVVGDFTVGFDPIRASGNASGFFVASTTGVVAPLFDVAVPSAATVAPDSLIIEADLLVASEFAGFLQTNGLASSDLTGADVGDARVAAAAIPEPTGLTLIALVAALGGCRRRR